jgi:hypothetical protein
VAHASGLSLKWDGGKSPADLGRRVADYKGRLRLAIRDLAEVYEGRFVDAAKGDAKWTDRTANARQGLSGTVLESGDIFEIILYHTMDYGIYLEVANDGTYAIILPTIDRMAPALMAAVAALMA